MIAAASCITGRTGEVLCDERTYNGDWLLIVIAAVLLVIVVMSLVRRRPSGRDEGGSRKPAAVTGARDGLSKPGAGAGYGGSLHRRGK